MIKRKVLCFLCFTLTAYFTQAGAAKVKQVA